MKSLKPLPRTFQADKMRTSYRRVASVYDLWAGLTESKAADYILQQMHFDSPKIVLEVACGTGALLCKIAAKNPNGEHTGLDLSPDMLKVAGQKMNKHRLTNITLQEGNAMSLPFEDAQFDVLVNNFMIDLLPESEFGKVASEFYRVLKPGGKLFVSTFAKGHGIGGSFWSWISRHFPALLTGCRPVAVSSNFSDVGFKIVKVTSISQLTFPSEVIEGEK